MLQRKCSYKETVGFRKKHFYSASFWIPVNFRCQAFRPTKSGKNTFSKNVECLLNLRSFFACALWGDPYSYGCGFLVLRRAAQNLHSSSTSDRKHMGDETFGIIFLRFGKFIIVLCSRWYLASHLSLEVVIM